MRDGLPALISQKKHVVMLRPNTRLVQANARPSFTLVVRNQSKKPETLYESSIVASQSIAGKTAPVRVLRYAELVQEEETRQAIAALGTALSGVGQAMSAANAGHTTTTGSIYSHGTYSTYTAQTYDPVRAQIAQQAAQARTAADFAALQAQGEQNLQILQRTILKDNTVMPGEWYGGSIVLVPPSKADDGGATYVITVSFGGEEHTFSISHVPS
jgi:hypothetical protein